MVNIELRQDGWFEAGKNSEKEFPYSYLVYHSKQKLKKALEKIGERSSIGKLEEALVEIPEVPYFKRRPYLRGNDIIIDTHGLPGECYLGSIKNDTSHK